MKATIITINWNNAQHTLNFVKSLNVLEFPFDLIVWDNGSDDRSALYTIKTSGGERLIIDSERNVGMPIPWNFGLKYAFDTQDSQLCFCCNNDIMFTKTINKIIPFIHSIPNPGIISPIEIGRDTNLDDLEDIAQTISEANESVPPVDGLTGPCMIFTQETYHKVGGFDEQFQFSFEDCDMYERCKKAGLQNLVHQQSIIYHYGGASTSKNPIPIETNPYYKLFQKKHGA